MFLDFLVSEIDDGMKKLSIEWGEKKPASKTSAFSEMSDRHKKIARTCKYVEKVRSVPPNPPVCRHPDGYGVCTPALCPKMDEWLKHHGEINDRVEKLRDSLDRRQKI